MIADVTTPDGQMKMKEFSQYSFEYKAPEGGTFIVYFYATDYVDACKRLEAIRSSTGPAQMIVESIPLDQAKEAIKKFQI